MRESVGQTDSTRGVRQKDLLSAGEAEVSKLKGGNFELISKLFTWDVGDGKGEMEGEREILRKSEKERHNVTV